MKKRGIIITIVIIVVVLIFIGGYFYFTEEPLLSPTDVKVKVGNAPPSIINTPNVNIPVTLTAATTKDVVVSFTVRDANGAGDLNDVAAQVTFSLAGETDRVGGCIVASQTSKEKTYDCTVAMQYYDAPGNWVMDFYIEDLATPPISDTATASANVVVGLLKAISFDSVIDLGVITPGQVDSLSSNIVLTNEGNFVAPVDGSVIINAKNLVGVTNSAENIPASGFTAADSSGDVCGTGTTLIHNTNVNVNVALPRGSSAIGNLAFCIPLVPEVSAQNYEATGGNAWSIEI